MAVTSYSELQSAIGDWLNRSDLTNAIKDFISLTEAELTRTLRHRKMVTRSTATIDSEYSATPADWFQTETFILNTDPAQRLEYVTNEALNRMKASSNATGRPRYYTHVGTEIQVYPTPDSQGYTGELVYYAKIPSLSDSNTTNWLLTLAPDLYLYGSLIQSAPYLQDDERLGLWRSLYQKYVADLEISNERASGQTSLRMRARPLH